MTVQSFIETQFPVSKLSKECYKERRSNQGQTLTGLGKWWGRKPLMLVRAAILGVLLPDSGNRARDREVFLKLLAMDEDGLRRRKSKRIPEDRVREILDQVRDQCVATRFPVDRNYIDAEDEELFAFERMSYDEKLNYCDLPEKAAAPSHDLWDEINQHLGTHAQSMPDLVRELGRHRWGRTPRVGDAFCGGGSVPFEASRLGCDAYASDLNPVAALLTQGSLQLIGGAPSIENDVQKALRSVYNIVDNQLAEWKVEHNESGWRADAYLYCVEADCPECGVRVPLLPSLVVGQRSRVVAVPTQTGNRFDIAIRSGVSDSEMTEAHSAGTVKNNALACPSCRQTTPISVLRGDRPRGHVSGYGLRPWENEDVVPRPDDAFHERVYCIRWTETYRDRNGKVRTRRHYRSPDDLDIAREAQVLDLVRERFSDWQSKGYIPNRRIEPGDETTRLLRERGWTHWHHLFTPRQLLTKGLMIQALDELRLSGHAGIAVLLAIGRSADWSSRLCRWGTGAARESIAQTFANQALNTLYNFGEKTLPLLEGVWFPSVDHLGLEGSFQVEVNDARCAEAACEIWVTDPPYADAVNYHELSEFFLAWYEMPLRRLFPDWYADSKRALAVVGSDENFRRSMVECYQNLAAHMPHDGMQVVMFTHQDASVWADLALILWAAGLRVTAAWTIATERDSTLRSGNYVQGTVLLVLRKQTGEDVAFLDEIYPEVQREVKRQLDEMLALDDNEEPNFGDTDYQLAAYAAALRVLTRYSRLGDLDLQRELSRPRTRGEVTAIEEVIANAVKIAADHLVPKGFNTFIWKTLTPEERFYLKGLDLESHGELRAGAYQELARGFGVRDYGELLESGRANETRVRTASGFGRRTLGGSGFGVCLVRNALFAVREAVSSDEPLKGRTWLQNEMPDYWNQRTALMEVLRYLARRGEHLDGWKEDARVAALVAGAVENHHV